MESYLEDEAWYLEFDKQLHSNLPLLLQLENDALVSALKQITEQGTARFFFLMSWRTKGFEELATELGITYKGAAAVYYRALQKIKKKIGEDRDGFHGTAEAGKDRK